MIATSLKDAVEDFKTAMLETDRAVKDHKLCDVSAQTVVMAACDAMESALRQHIVDEPDRERIIGGYVFRETFPYLTRSRFVDRAFTKPRGYAGDYATIDMLYDDTADGDGRLGPLIDRWTLEVPAAQAVKNRRALMASTIREVAADYRGEEPAPITSLAAGPARELFDVILAPDAPRVLATCIDVDQAALDYATNLAREREVADRFVFAQDNVVRLSRGYGRTVLDRPQALVYSIGLTDYLADQYVVELINWSYDQLAPGGTLVIGNVVPSNPNKAYMDHILEWVLIHRTADELRELFARSRFAATPVRLWAEPAGVDLFAACRKN